MKKEKKSFTPVKYSRAVHHRRNLTGFTLVELLVVIAIIGIITAFIVVNVRSAQSRARDAKRVSDLEALNTAIQMYYRATGHFPGLPSGCGNAAGNGVSSNQVTRWATGNCWTSEFIKGLAPAYMPKLPIDDGPKLIKDGEVIRGFVYFHTNVNSLNIECYKIMAFNPENPKSTQYKSIWDPARDGGDNISRLDGNRPWAWALYSRGCANQ